MGGSYVIQEGYLLYKYEDEEHHISLGWKHTGRLQERYFVLSMNRKMEIYENSNKEKQVDSANIVGFCAWDGGGLLKVDSYGVELKVERSAHKKMFLAAYNRLDLEKWCKAFLGQFQYLNFCSIWRFLII
jgi:hypothetical protein